jgi:hypothetical protein
MAKLISKTLSISKLAPKDVSRMFDIFQKYYANASMNVFEKDLKSKDVVFLLLDSKTQEIQGFSTLVNLNVEVEGKVYTAAFSGDTIIEKAYWGQGALGVAFLKYLFTQKLKNPFKPYYWFLISKGFKTYVLMANNFGTHYPRHEEQTPPKFKKIIGAMSRELYGDRFEEETGLIVFNNEDQKDALKDDVAPITLDMLKNDRISYFVKKNPDWIKGNELACLAEMTLTMPLYYQMKIIVKRFSKITDKAISKLAVILGAEAFKRDE